MASRRSHAASHNITSISTRYKITYYSRVPRGHVYIRNPLQAAKQRSCGIHYYRSRSAEPAAHTICIIFLSKKHVCMSSCLKTCLHVFLSKKHVFMSSCLKNMSACLNTKKGFAILNRETLFVMSMLCGYAAYILSSYYLTTTLRVVPSESLRMLMPLTGAETSEPSAA